MINIKIINEDDIIYARSEARMLADANGFSVMNKTRLATAVSELARNIFRYAVDGEVIIETITEGDKCGILCQFIDKGPGIESIDQVMQNGFSGGKSLGFGLPGSQRLADKFSIESELGVGTHIEIVKWQ